MAGGVGGSADQRVTRWRTRLGHRLRAAQGGSRGSFSPAGTSGTRFGAMRNRIRDGCATSGETLGTCGEGGESDGVEAGGGGGGGIFGGGGGGAGNFMQTLAPSRAHVPPMAVAAVVAVGILSGVPAGAIGVSDFSSGERPKGPMPSVTFQLDRPRTRWPSPDRRVREGRRQRP